SGRAFSQWKYTARGFEDSAPATPGSRSLCWSLDQNGISRLRKKAPTPAAMASRTTVTRLILLPWAGGPALGSGCAWVGGAGDATGGAGRRCSSGARRERAEGGPAAAEDARP